MLTPSLFDFFRDFNDFRVNANSVDEAHLPNLYDLLCLRPENTAWHFFEPTLKKLIFLQGSSSAANTSFFNVFGVFNDFHVHKNIL